MATAWPLALGTLAGMTPDPDLTLVDAARRRDAGACELLYRRHCPTIHTYALRCAHGRHHLADEITQETFVRAFRALDGFDGRSTFRTWLFSIAINVTRTIMKRAGTETARHAPENAAVDVPAPPATTADAWSAQHVRHALAQLPEGYRDALVMHDVLGMEHQEIAQLKECSVGASKSQLHKARARLRALLLPRLKGDNHDVTTP